MHVPLKRVYNEEQTAHTLLLEHEVQPVILQFWTTHSLPSALGTKEPLQFEQTPSD